MSGPTLWHRLVLGALALGATACAEPPPPGIVLVTLDTLRADRLGAYGHQGGLTPALDALAREGTVFEDVTAPAPITLPSHASLFTGRYPPLTGVRNNGSFVLPEDERTLAEVLREAGWTTGAVVGAFPLIRRFGTAQGFDRYDDAVPEPGHVAAGALPVHFPERRAGEVTDRALALWAALGDGPRFLWVHYFDPHAPYDPPAEFLPGDDAELAPAARQRHRYDGEVAYTDREVGRLLRQILEKSPETIVAVASDHGEALGEHGEKTHGVFLYQGTLSVPLILRAPGKLPAGSRISVPASLVDVMPTLLGLAGVEAPDRLDGTDLAPLARGGRAPEREIYAESMMARLDYRFAELRAMRAGRLKYIEAPTPELYDLATDPGEQRSLVTARPEAGASLAERLAELIASFDTDSARAAATVDSEGLARLRSLGYVAGGPLADDSPGGRDPKDMIDYFRRHDVALGAISRGDTEEGVAELRALRPLAPENYLISYQIAAALLAAGDPQGAAHEASIVTETDPSFAGGHLLLGEALFALGEIDRGSDAYRRAAELMPESGEPDASLGDRLVQAGRFAEAGRAYGRALDREPHRFGLVLRLLELWESRGDLARARTDLAALAESHPDSAALLTGRAIVERRAGDDAAALALVQRALEIRPHDLAALVELGELELAAGRPDAAEQAFRLALRSNAESTLALAGLARVLLERGEHAAAAAEIERLQALRPGYAGAYSLRGRLLEQTGQRSAAAAAYREALRLDPSDRTAREGLARLRGHSSAGGMSP